MRLGHYEAFRPVCVRCRISGAGDHRIELRAERRDEVRVLEGMLTCPACKYEYPIFDGIPLLVADVRDHVSRQLGELRARDDLSPFAESMLGDCAGPDSELGRDRMYLASYGRAHWADHDRAQPGEATLVPVLDAALALAGEVRGRWLDLGCAMGRGTFTLAARTGEPALGLDMNLAMLKAARRIVVAGKLRHAIRQVGVVYDQRDEAIDPAGRALADFWYADATALPFAADAVDGALSLNLLDSVASPLGHLTELGRALAPAGRAVIATPYDWTGAVTPLEAWLGGHSQRGGVRGSSAATVRHILTVTPRPEGSPALALDTERDDVPWTLDIHERARITYTLHMMRVSKRPSG